MKKTSIPEATLTPAELSTAIARLIEAGITAFIHGRPGIGKSAIVERLAESAGVECRVLSLSLMQPEDIRIPVPDASGRVLWRYADALPSEGRGILFLDEFPQAHESVQSVFGQLIHLGRMDHYTLPSGWAIVCAGNRAEDMAATHTIPTQIRNRVCHLHLETSIRDWAEYDPDAAPAAPIEKWPEHRMTDAAPHPILRAMAQVRSDALSTPENWTELTAWPTPRTLSLASGYLRRVDRSLRQPDSIDWAIVSGLVGAPCASEIQTFWKLRDQVPTAEQIAAGSAKIPDELPARWVCAMMVADMAVNKPTEPFVSACMAYIEQMGLPYLAAVAMPMVHKIHKIGVHSVYAWKCVIRLAELMSRNGIIDTQYAKYIDLSRKQRK